VYDADATRNEDAVCHRVDPDPGVPVIPTIVTMFRFNYEKATGNPSFKTDKDLSG